jgi:hypothetical protein
MSSLKDLANRLRQSMPGQVVEGMATDFGKTLGNIGAGVGTLAGFGTQALADRRTRQLEEANRLAKQAISATGAQKQFLLGQSRDISFRPTISPQVNQLVRGGTAGLRQLTGTQQPGFSTLRAGIAPAVNVGLYGTGLKAFKAMPIKSKLLTGALGAGIPAGIAAVTGQNPLEAATAGVLSTPKYVGLGKITEPVTRIMSAGWLRDVNNPAIRATLARGISGAANVIEDEFLAKLEGTSTDAYTKALSFGLGALMTDPKAVDSYIKDLNPNDRSVVRKVIRDAQGKFRSAKDQVMATIKKGGDVMISPMIQDKDGNMVQMKMSEYIKKVRSGEIQDPSIGSVVSPKSGPKAVWEADNLARLRKEAKKYKSATDFYNAKGMSDDFRDAGIRGNEQFTNFWEKATKGVDKTPVIDGVNPTGSVFVDYNPQARATAKLGKNMTTLANTSGKSPDTMVTIYRGAPKTQKGIVAGDFITTDYNSAKSYIDQDGIVLEKKVRLGDILDDITDPQGGDYLYRPKADLELSKSGPTPEVTPPKMQGQEQMITRPRDQLQQRIEGLEYQGKTKYEGEKMLREAQADDLKEFDTQAINKLRRLVNNPKTEGGDAMTYSKYHKDISDMLDDVQNIKGFEYADDAMEYVLSLPTKTGLRVKMPDELREAKTLKEQLKTTKNLVFNSELDLPKPKEKIQAEKIEADRSYKEWQKQLFKQEGLVTKAQMEKGLIDSAGKAMERSSVTGNVPVDSMKDLSGFNAYTRDLYRNFEDVYGKNISTIKKSLLDPFDKAKGDLTRSYSKWVDRVSTEVEGNLGIKKGSKESAAVQNYGEGKITYNDLVKDFGEKQAGKVVQADKWFRKEYDQLLDEVNATMRRIYPNNPEKIIPKRKDYYRHFRDMSNSISGLLNIFDSPSNIASSLAGTSETTRPKSKWLSFAQKRLGKQTDEDAVGGFLDYIKAAEYNKKIDPFIDQFRTLARDLAEKTETSPKLNNFIEYVNDFANDLAGKTNPADRFIQKVIPGGRKSMSAINWLNNRVKANVILGNVSSSIAQIFNVPQGIAEAGLVHSTKGLGATVANIFGEATPIKQSNFIAERYGGDVFNRFDRSMVDNVKKGAAWITGVLDEVGTKYIWNSIYSKAIDQGIPNPTKYADDITRKMVAGRGIGEVPLIQKSKIFQMVAPFQLEVGNLWHVMGEWVGKKEFGKLATFFVASHVFNKVAEEIRGSDVSLDPIQASIDAYNTYSEEDDKGMGALKAGGRIAGEALSNIPLAQNLAAVYPEFGFSVGDTKMPTRSDLFGEGDPTRFGSGLVMTKGLQDPLFKIIPPFGGQQIKRSIEGQQATNKGYSESATGRVRFPVEDTPLRNLQRLAFGQYSTPAAREYFDADTSTLGDKQSATYKDLMKKNPDQADRFYQNIIINRDAKEGGSIPQVQASDKLTVINDEVLKVEKEAFKNSTETARQVADNIYFIKNDDNSVSTIDISKEIDEPKYTGNEAIDKKLKSQYKSSLTRRGNDIVKLLEAGQIDLEQATAMMDEVEIKYDTTLKSKKAKKPKKITVRSVSVKIPKLSAGTRSKPPKLTLPKPPSIKVKASQIRPGKISVQIKKPQKIKVKGFRNTLQVGTRLA